MNPEDIIISYYRNRTSRGESFKNQINGISCYNKLGEAVMLSSIPEKATLSNKNIGLNKNLNYFLNLILEKNPFFINEVTENVYSMHHLVENFNCGNGNILQQIYRVIGLEVDIKPKGNLYINKKKIKNKIGIHIDGASAGRFYGRARDIYDENIKILQNFIINNPQYSFIQFGQGRTKDENIIASGICKPVNENKDGLFNNVEDFLNKNLEETLEKIAECEYFICLNSGFYHAAIALDIKTICIINLPNIEHCYLPILVNEMLPCAPPYSLWDKNWLYPQAVHLHQDGENELVKRFSEENLKKAINGDIYPFWEEKYLSLIYDYERICF